MGIQTLGEVLEDSLILLDMQLDDTIQCEVTDTCEREATHQMVCPKCGPFVFTCTECIKALNDKYARWSQRARMIHGTALMSHRPCGTPWEEVTYTPIKAT